MIELLKAALAKARKGRTNGKSPARSVRSFTPNRTPRAEIDLSMPRRASAGRGDTSEKPLLGRNNSAGAKGLMQRKTSSENFDRKLSPMGRSGDLERRSFTPRGSSRSNFEKSLPVDFRKLIRDKVDRKMKEKFVGVEKDVYRKWGEMMRSAVKELVELRQKGLVQDVRGMVEGRFREIVPRLSEFANRSAEVLKQNKVQKPVRGTQRPVESTPGDIEELVKDTFSKAQYRASNAMERNIEAKVVRSMKTALDLNKQAIRNEVQKCVLAVFNDLKPRVLNLIQENTTENFYITGTRGYGMEKKQVSHENKASYKQNIPISKSEKKINPAGSLKEFLEYEKTIKASK